MDNINNQAKDEIRELLNDLVVSPVSQDLEKQLKDISDILSKIIETPNKLSALQGVIQRESGKVSDKFDNKIEEVHANILSCEDKIKKIKPKIDGLISRNERIDKELNKISEDINAFKSSCELINQQIEKSKQIDSKLDSLKSLINSNEQLANIEQKSIQILNVLQDIDNRSKTLTNSLNEMSNSFVDKSQETSEYYLRHYKQNKVSFLIIIVLSVINMFGLIGVILCTLYTVGFCRF